jgi:hypothetical protein
MSKEPFLFVADAGRLRSFKVLPVSIDPDALTKPQRLLFLLAVTRPDVFDAIQRVLIAEGRLRICWPSTPTLDQRHLVERVWWGIGGETVGCLDHYRLEPLGEGTWRAQAL